MSVFNHLYNADQKASEIRRLVESQSSNLEGAIRFYDEPILRMIAEARAELTLAEELIHLNRRLAREGKK